MKRMIAVLLASMFGFVLGCGGATTEVVEPVAEEAPAVEQAMPAEEAPVEEATEEVAEEAPAEETAVNETNTEEPANQ